MAIQQSLVLIMPPVPCDQLQALSFPWDVENFRIESGSRNQHFLL